MATLLQLMTAACIKADRPVPTDDDEFVGRAALVNEINEGIVELHHKATSGAHPLYYRVQDFSLSGSTYAYALPATFARLRFLELNPDTASRRKVTRMNFDERDSAQFSGAYGARGSLVCTDRHYSLVGVSVAGTWTLQVQPQESAGGNYRAYYIPKPVTLSLDADVLDPELEPWKAYPTFYAARFMAVKSDDFEKAADFAAQLLRIEKDLADALEPDEGGPATIIDALGDD